MKKLGTLIWDEELGGLSLTAILDAPDYGRGWVVSVYRPDGHLVSERFYFAETVEDAIKAALKSTEKFKSETKSFSIMVETQAMTLTGHRERHYVEPEFQVKTL